MHDIDDCYRRWEDEQEFDAITEILLPKCLHIVSLHNEGFMHVIGPFQDVRFATAFCDPRVIHEELDSFKFALPMLYCRDR